MTILDMLGAQQARRGPAPAILAPGRDPLSYAALYHQIDRIGTNLASMGLGRHSRVALSLSDGPEGAVTMLATMIWATAAPLGAGLDVEAYADLLVRLRTDAVILHDGEGSPLARAASALRLPLLHVSSHPGDAGGDLVSAAARAPVLRTPPQAGDLAVLMQTSGTTARPKIVPVTHAQLMWTAHQQPIDERDRYLAIGPLYSSTGFMSGLLVPLTAGAATVIAGAYDGARFVDWLDQFKPTYFSANPTVLASMLDAADAARTGSATFAAFRSFRQQCIAGSDPAAIGSRTGHSGHSGLWHDRDGAHRAESAAASRTSGRLGRNRHGDRGDDPA